MQDMVAEEYHLDVLGINLHGSRKTSKKQICVSLPQAKRVRKNQNSIRVPGTRGRDQPVSDRPNPTKLIQIRPIPWSLGQIWPNHVPDVVRPILAPESRSRGIRWGDRHHFSSRICSDGSRGLGGGSEVRPIGNSGGWGVRGSKVLLSV